MIAQAYAEQNTFREARSYGESQIAGCAIEPKRRDITSEVIDLRDLITEAHEIFTILDKKTVAIRYQSPQCDEKDGTPISGGSEVRATLAEQNQRLRALMRRMSVMIDEIDL